MATHVHTTCGLCHDDLCIDDMLTLHVHTNSASTIGIALSVGFPGSGDGFNVSVTTGVGPAPAPSTSASEVPLSTATAVTGGGVPSSPAANLPVGSTQQTCQQFQSACISSESTAAPFEFSITLTCLPSSTAQVGSKHVALSLLGGADTY